MEKMKVKVKEALLRVGPGDYVLDVSNSAFKENPDKTYSVPTTSFWWDLVHSGMLIPVEKKVTVSKGEQNEKTD